MFRFTVLLLKELLQVDFWLKAWAVWGFAALCRFQAYEGHLRSPEVSMRVP